MLPRRNEYVAHEDAHEEGSEHERAPRKHAHRAHAVEPALARVGARRRPPPPDAVAAGALVSTLEDEAGTAEEVSAGQMCGESAALTKARRASTVACAADGPAQVYVLGSIALAALPAELKLELALLSMRYMSHRLDHVANRIWTGRSSFAEPQPLAP